jgi:hypothetical protein
MKRVYSRLIRLTKAVGLALLGGVIGLWMGANAGGNAAMGYERGGLIGLCVGIVAGALTSWVWTEEAV